MFPGFALSSAPPSCHRGRGAAAAGVDEGVPDLAPVRDQIRSYHHGCGASASGIDEGVTDLALVRVQI